MAEQKDNTVKDKMNLFVLKNQKLAQALYAVTSFCPESEPLKTKLRDQAINLTTILNRLKTDEVAVYQLSFLNQISTNIQLILDLCDLAQAGNVLSSMNVSIIKQEYELLLKEARERLVGSYLLDLPMTTAPTITSSIGQAFRPKEIKDNKTDSISPRQQQIIKILQGQGWLGIKDIADAVPDFSTKTVQRELAALVDFGVLKKQGDRRWSRYVLAKADTIAK